MNNKQLVTSDISKYCYKLNVRVSYLYFSGSLFVALFVSLLMINNVFAQEGQSGYKITSPVSGVIKTVYVKPGQMVKKGDLLLEFDDSLIASNLSEVKAKIQLAKLNKVEAKKEFARAEELYDRTVLSDQELQQANVLYSKALAQYAAAKNELVHAQWDMDHTKLYAAFAGQVSQIYSYPGQYVNNEFTAQTLLIIK